MTTPKTIVQAIANHIDGWRSATFGWQDDPDPVKAERNQQFAIQAHAAECIRRIRDSLAAPSAEGVGSEGVAHTAIATLDAAMLKAPDQLVTGVRLGAPERWIVAREEAVQGVTTRAKLGYTVLAEAEPFDSFESASAWIRKHELPLGWVAMRTTQAPWNLLFPAPTAPAGGEAPAEASDAQLMIVAQEMGLWCEAYTAPRESGVATELDITPEDAAEFNAASLKDIRAALKAAGLYTHPSADLRGAAEQALDAARYRFLRDVAHPDTNSGLRCVGNCADGGEPLHIGGRDLDRAVDAAIASLEAAISRKGKTE